jgi:hypothetical protein
MPVAPCRKLRVSARDLEDLRGSGLSEETIRANGLYTEEDSHELATILNQLPDNPRKQIPLFCIGGALVFPYRNLAGEVNGFARAKPHSPRTCKGKPNKYEQPAGQPARAYFPVASLALLRDGVSDVFVTEGEKKALALSQLVLAAIGLGGVWSWRKKGTDELIDDLLSIHWEGRRAYISFDWDPKSETRRKVAEAARRLARALRQAGAKEVYLVELPPGPDGGKQGPDDLIVAHDADAYLALVEQAKPVPDLVQVVLGTDEHRVNAECEAALVARAMNLYQRGGSLVRVLRHEPEGKQRIVRPAAAPIIRPLPAALLREELTAHVECVRRVKMKEGFEDRPASLPGHVVSTIHVRGHWRGLPSLEAVYSHPVLLPDGSVLAEPGYHSDSGLMLWLPDGLHISVPHQPSYAEMVYARQALRRVVCDFPFKDECHESAWLAFLLTPLARPAFTGPVPLAFADGNVPGCGKGLVLDTAFLIVTGRSASVATYTNDQEELRKVITTVALDGDEMVLFDNVSGAFGNATLDRLLTGASWEDRILGGNTKYDGPMLTLFSATGNNVYPVGDTPRRLLPIRLESDLENPEDRDDFKIPKLREYVLQHRGRLLSAALTILRAYCAEGRPDQKLRPWGSYEGWSDLIRGTIVWAGMADPGEARMELRRVASPETTALADLLAGILHLDPKGQGLTVADILSTCETCQYMGDEEVKALREALCTLCPRLERNGLPSTKSIGVRFHQVRGRVIGNLRLEQLLTNHHSSNRWRVVTMRDRGRGSGGK